MQLTQQKYIFWDLDGVLMGWTGKVSADQIEVSKFFNKLNNIPNETVKHSIFSNRPTPQVLPFIYYLGCDNSLHSTESGAVTFDPKRFQQYINPIYIEYINKTRPEILEYLESKYFLKESAIELKGSIVKIEILAGIKNDISSLYDEIKKDKFFIRFASIIDINFSKIIEIVPKNMNKINGLKPYLDLTMKIYDESVNWKNSAFIADSNKDIEIATKLNQIGVLVCSVGNASEDYKNFVLKSGGIVAPSSTTHYGSVNYILSRIFN